MINAVTICMKKYLTFSGRATRSEFWYFFLFLALGHLALIVVNSILFGPEVRTFYRLNADGQPAGEPLTEYRYNGGVVGNAFFLATFLPWLAAGWRRMQDSGRPGYLPWLAVLVTIVTIIGLTIGLRSEGPGVFVLILVSFIGTLILNVYWLTRPTEPGSNRYGPNPHEVTP